MKNRTELIALLPKHRDDVASAEKLVALGYPALAPVLPQMFQWLCTNGSGVELVMRSFFAGLGAPARDLVCAALEARIKPALKLCLLRDVLPAWPRAVVATLESQLEPHLQEYDFHGLDVWALKLMIANGLYGHHGDDGLEKWKHLKIARLREQLNALTE